MTNKKTIALGIGILLLGVFLISFASAEFWACFEQGERIDYCDNYRDSETYEGSFPRCMSVYDAEEDCYVHGVWPKCNSLPQECSDVGDGGDIELDVTPPQFSLTSPINNSVFTDSRVLVEFALNEKSDVEYKNLNDQYQRWSRVCSDCLSYSNEKYFDEGENIIMFRALDSRDNENITIRHFFIDSREPRIYSTEPRRGEYSSGKFLVEFDEANPEELLLKIDYSGGTDTYEVNLSNCVEDYRTTNCEANIDVSKYSGEEVEYYFELEDLAGNKVSSYGENVKVDSVAPVINSIEKEFDGRSLNFIVDFTEEFPESITYIDLNDDRSRPRDLCRRFENGNCTGRVSLRDGNYSLEFEIKDEAGAKDTKIQNVFIDTTAPRIYRTYPYRGFADGNFDVQFMEDNPKKLTLYYGDKNVEVNLSNCNVERGRSYCSTNVDLNEFNGKEIEYYFELEDIVGNKDSSRKVEVSVDTESPVLENENNFWEQGEGRYSRYVFFNLEIDEENLEEVVYSYEENGRMYERRLCSRLRDGVCERQVPFREGTYNVNLQINDEAGNSVGVSTGEFDVEY